MYNIVFSTTRQSNPGDEFILLGTQNILTTIGVRYNPIIYNRNLELIRYRKYNRIKNLFSVIPYILKNLLYFNSRLPSIEYDNSFNSRFFKNKYIVSFVVIAGSPSWSNGELNELYRYTKTFNIPLLMLGIGGKSRFSKSAKWIRNIIANAKVITNRDTQSKAALQGKGIDKSIVLPCPALFSSPWEKCRVVSEVRTIGLIYGHYKASPCNNISKETYEYLIKLYAAIIEKYKDVYNFKLIAHYVDEPMLFKNELPLELVYSYNSNDYINIYGECDVVIGHRIHGIGLAASMGIPGLGIKHCARSETINGFLAESANVGEDINTVLEKINNIIKNVKEKSEAVYRHKKVTLEEYRKLLSPLFDELGK